MEEDSMEDKLFSITQKEYGSEYKSHYFDQYKLYIDGIEKTSDRRQNALNFYLTINTLLIPALGLSFQFSGLNEVLIFKVFLTGIGVILSGVFYFLINSYKQLNTGKFNILHRIESKLPISTYKEEWQALGGGKDLKKYFPFSHIERLIPIFFGILYLMMAIGIVYSAIQSS